MQKRCKQAGGARLVQLACQAPTSDIEILDNHFRDTKQELRDLGVLSDSAKDSKIASLIAAVILGSRSWPEEPSEQNPKPDYLGIQRPSTAMVKAAKKLKMVMSLVISESSDSASRIAEQQAVQPVKGTDSTYPDAIGSKTGKPAPSPDNTSEVKGLSPQLRHRMAVAIGRGRSSGNRSDPRPDSIETVNAGPTGRQQVHLGTREWFMRVTEAATCAYICEPGKVRNKVCCGRCRRWLAPVCDLTRTWCCNFSRRYALGQSTATYSQHEGVVVSTYMYLEQSKMALAFAAVMFALMWTSALVVALMLRLSTPRYKDAAGGDLRLDQNVVYILVQYLSESFPGSYRYDTTVAMVVAILLFIAQSVGYLLRRAQDQLQPNTVSVSDRLLSIAPVTAHRFFVSYKWGPPKGSLVAVHAVNIDSHNADDPDILPTAVLNPDTESEQYLNSTAGAEGLARSLARALPNAWVDVMKLPNAASLHASIYSDLEGAMSTIVLMTPGYLGSVNCNFELLCLLKMHADAVTKGQRSRLTQASRVVVYLPVDGDMPGLKWPEWTDTADVWKQYNREKIKSCLLDLGVSVVETGHDLLRHIHDRMFMGLGGDQGHSKVQLYFEEAGSRSSGGRHGRRNQKSGVPHAKPNVSGANVEDPDAVVSVHTWWSKASRVEASAKSAVGETIVPVDIPAQQSDHIFGVCPASFICAGSCCPPPRSVHAGNLWIASDGSSWGRMYRVAPGLWFLVSIIATLLYGLAHMMWSALVLEYGWFEGIDPPLLGTSAFLLIISWLVADGAADLNWRYQHSPCMNKILMAGHLQRASKSKSPSLGGAELQPQSSLSNMVNASGREGNAEERHSRHSDTLDQAAHEYVGHHLRYKLRFAFMMGGREEATRLVETHLRSTKARIAKNETDKAAGKQASVAESLMTMEQAMSIVRPDAAVNTCKMLRALDFQTQEYQFDTESRRWTRQGVQDSGEPCMSSRGRHQVCSYQDQENATKSPLSVVAQQKRSGRDGSAAGKGPSGSSGAPTAVPMASASSDASNNISALGVAPIARSPPASIGHQTQGGNAQIYRHNTEAAYIDTIQCGSQLSTGVVYCFVISTVAQAEAYLDFIHGNDTAQVVLMVHSSVPRGSAKARQLYDALHVSYKTDPRESHERLPRNGVISCSQYTCWRFGPSVCYSQCPSCCPSCYCGCCCWLGVCCGFCSYSRDIDSTDCLEAFFQSCSSSYCCETGSARKKNAPENQDVAQQLLETLSSKVASTLHPG